jgi:DmsE family decaheme c-type cytochrome
MAWHSSLHSTHGVACTDCHNPHPRTCVPQVVEISHTNINRPNRMPMSVQEPEACYKCHPEIYGRTAMTSHHPIREGKMTCSDCHDAHGQFENHLKEETVNLVCWKCHAEFQGPYAYEHPPVTENCAICHEPHGSANPDLMRQPVTFLCLRCHSGHRGGPRGPNHDPFLLPDMANNPHIQGQFFTKCTQCHSQVHGSDVPTPHLPGALMR